MPDYRLQYVIRASDQATRIFARTNSALGQLGQQAHAVGRDLTVGLTLPIVGMGTAAVKAAGDLDQGMKNIQSISKQTDRDINALSDSFVDMSTDLSQTTDSAAGLASAFYDIQGSGFAGADAMRVLEAATMAASAGLTKTDVAAEAVSAKLNAYGETAAMAEETSDKMFRTVDRGVGTFSELANALGYVVGTAAQAGVSFDDVSGALSTMSKQAINFQMGARALNNLLIALITPSDEMAAALNEIGFASGQAALDSLGLAGVLRELERAGYGGTEGLASLGLSTYALRAALALTGEGARSYAEDVDAMADSTGAAQEAFDIQTKSFNAQWMNLRNTLTAGVIPAGTMLIRDVLIPMGKEITPIVRSIADLDPATLRWALRLAAVAMAAGPVLTITGRLVGVYDTLKGAIEAITAASGAKTVAIQGQTAQEVAGLVAAKRLVTVFGGLASAAAAVGTVLGMVGASFALQQKILQLNEKAVLASSESYEEYTGRMDGVISRMKLLAQLHPAFQAGMQLMTGLQQMGAIALQKTEEEWTAVTAVTEEATRALMESTRELREQARAFSEWEDSAQAGAYQLSGFVEEQRRFDQAMEAQTAALHAMPMTEHAEALDLAAYAWDRYAQTAQAGAYSLADWDEEAFRFQQMMADHERQLEDLGLTMGNLGDIVGAGYAQLLSATETYSQQLLEIEEQSAWNRQLAELDFHIGRQERAAQYNQQMLFAEAEHQAAVLGLQMQGKDAELGNLETAHQKQLDQSAWRFATAETQADYSYQKQLALAEVHQQRQLYIQALAHHAQLKEDLAYFSEQTQNWLVQNKAFFEAEGAKYFALLMLLGDYHGEALKVERAAALAHLDLEEIKAQATQKGSEATILAIRTVIDAYEAAVQAAAGNVDAAKQGVDAALDALGSIRLKLPPVPDFTQYMPDYGEIAGRAERASRAATGAASSHVVDFQEIIEAAIDALDRLAGYEAPEAIREGAENLKDALISIMPVLRQLDDVLDDTISREGMEKISLFAGTIRELASSIESMQQLAAFQRPDEWTGPFLALQEVMIDLAWAFEVAQETWDKYLSKDQIAEIGSFADSVFKLAEAMAEFRGLGTMTTAGPNWVEDFLEDFLVNLDALAAGLAEMERQDYAGDLSTGFVELLGATGRSIQDAQAGLMAIASRWQVGDMRGSTDAFIEDIDYVLRRLAAHEAEWGDLDYSGVLAYLSGTVGEIADLVANLSTDFRSQMQPIGYELMMGIRDGIEEGGPAVLEYLLEALTDIAGVAGLGGLPEAGGGAEGLGLAGGPGALFILAPIFIDGDEYRDAGGDWEFGRLADDLMASYERDVR